MPKKFNDPPTCLDRRNTAAFELLEEQGKVQEKIEFDERIRLAAKRKMFRVLEVAAANADRAAKELGRRLQVTPTSIDREILRTMKGLIVEWEIPDERVILQADREGPSGPDWNNLRELMLGSAKRVASRLASESGVLLLTDPGILARYRLDRFLPTLLEATQKDDGPGVLLVLPVYEDPHAASAIDAVTGPLPVPITSPGQRLTIPESSRRSFPNST